MIPEDLDRLAEKVKDEFVAAKRAAYPNYSVNTRRHGMKLWRQVAMRIKDFEYDPVLYARSITHAYGATAYPNMLMTKDHDDIYRGYTEVENAQKQERILQELHRQVSYIELRRNQGQDLETILTDSLNSFDSLFIWCMARANGLEELAARYAAKAEDYMLRPIYKAVYTKTFNAIDFGGIDHA